MAPDEPRKGRFFFFANETIQQLLVRPWAGFSPFSELPNVLEYGVELPGGHDKEFRAKQALGYYLSKLEHGGGKKFPKFLAIDGMILQAPEEQEN